MAAGLSFTAYYTRKLIKWGGVGIIIYIIAHISVVSIYRAIQNRAQEPPPPVAAYGPLPYVEFPSQDDNLEFIFRLETISGELPSDFPDRVNVFVSSNYQPNFQSYNSANDKAMRLGFRSEPLPVTESRYRWRMLDGLTGLLELHIFRGDFDMILDWASNESLLVSPTKGGSRELQAFNASKSVIQKVGSWSPDWNGGSYATLYYEYVNGQLVQVDRLTKADFLHVNLRPKPLAENMDFVSADPQRPAVWALVSRLNNQVVEMHFRYFGINRDQFTDYPIEPIQNVWQEVQNNQLYIASIGENQPGQEVIIRHFSLGYFLPTHYTQYIQPVFIIQGDNGFVGYSPAIDRQLIAR